MFAYKLNTPLPMLEQMQWLDIIIMYKELADIIKQENGEGDGNNQMQQFEDMKSNMDADYSSKMNQMKSSMPKINTPNFGSLTSGLKIPKL